MTTPDSTVPERRIYRRDYKAPLWHVERIHLHFDLGQPTNEAGEHSVLVRCRQQLRSRTGEPGVLVLDGREMTLIDVRIDGESLPASRYTLTPEHLSIEDVPATAELEICGRLRPFANSSLEGLYGSSGLLCTQCESHGFSRITWCLDRPDVLSIYTVEICADAERYPVLLSNGNRVSEEVDDGRRTVVWHDPHPKPCYLFALVAGQLNCVRAEYQTASGRDVSIEFWCDPGLELQLDHAVRSLQNAMRFDEQAYQREYDLDLYMVVVARAFNMGAMENKGLNIFNPKCVLAHPDTATDADHVMVEAVVAHEYLHNWTGNRITCRDWFQLSLKEGLTVFREQHFSARHAGGAAQRIQEVALLKARQFVEDSGPLAHPVRPESYVDMNNFYTVTVYEKGAELIRVLRAIVGEPAFDRGMQHYFATLDGQAATIEDFLQCFALEDAGASVEEMLRWYDQPGTPRLGLRLQPHTHDAQTLTAELQQSPPAIADPSDPPRPVPQPVVLEFLDARGPLLLADGQSRWSTLLRGPQQRTDIRFARSAQGRVTPVFSGGFPAPVRVEYDYQPAELARIVEHASDPVARWDAQQRRIRRQLDAAINASGGDIVADWAPLLAVRDQVLAGTCDAAVAAELLSLPAAATLLAEGDSVDPLALAATHERLERQLAQALWVDDVVSRQLLHVPDRWEFTPDDVARRRLAVRMLELGLLADVVDIDATVDAWLQDADNLTLRFGALAAVWRADHPQRDAYAAAFANRHAHDPLVLDRLFALQARHASLDALQALLADGRYQRTQPNRVRAVLDTLVRQNLPTFYASDQRALGLWAEELMRLDEINPQLAARLVGALESSHRLAQPWRQAVYAALEQLRRCIRSPNLHEQLRRLLAAA